MTVKYVDLKQAISGSIIRLNLYACTILSVQELQANQHLEGAMICEVKVIAGGKGPITSYTVLGTVDEVSMQLGIIDGDAYS